MAVSVIVMLNELKSSSVSKKKSKKSSKGTTNSSVKVKFSDLGLKKDILSVLARLNFHYPTQVQAEIVPQILSDKNVIFTSPTGSGKTLAFLLGYLGKLNKKQGVQMVVLVPTRELAVQVEKELKSVCDLLGLKVGVLYGGRDFKGDTRTLVRKNQIMVGTPGRLLQHVNEKSLKVGDVKYLVFDESDQMFDDGFYEDCKYLKSRVSVDCQIVLSSATMTEKVVTFVEKEIVHFEFFEIGELIPSSIQQEKYYVPIPKKNQFLLDFFADRKFKRALIFCNKKTRSEEIEKFFSNNGYRTRSLNADLEQKEREAYLDLFRQGKINILVATDVAARGLHIKQVRIVVNYDVPTRDEFYVHRIGRSGRNGAKGYAISLVCPEDEERFERIESTFDLDVSLYEESSFDEFLENSE